MRYDLFCPVRVLKILQRGHKFVWNTFDQTLVIDLGPVHMIPGQFIAPGQLTDPGVNIASVHGLTPVTVRMRFSLPRGNFELPVAQHRVTRLAEVTFLHVNRT